MGKLGRYVQKMTLDYLLIPHTRLNSGWTKDFNVRLKNIKLLEKNISSKISDISLSNVFSIISPWAREMRKTKQVVLHKTKNKTTY